MSCLEVPSFIQAIRVIKIYNSLQPWSKLLLALFARAILAVADVLEQQGAKTAMEQLSVLIGVRIVNSMSSRKAVGLS